MKLLRAFLFALAALVLCARTAASAEEVGENQVLDGLREHGMDWLKDQAKQAGEDWIFDTDQSETMHAILKEAEDRSNGQGNDSNGRCQGAVMGLASTILSNTNLSWSVKTAARLSFDTMTKLAGLAAGGLTAVGEGGALSWLADQYVGAATDKAKEAAFDRIKRAFIDEKEPEFEIFEKEGDVGSGNCSYTLRAVWDIVHGTYRVYIAGDCHCQAVGNVGVVPRPLGAWWISFEGQMRLRVDRDAGTSTWVPMPPRMDFDAQCACGRNTLRQAFAPPPSTQPSITPTPPSGTSPTPPSGTGGTTTTPGTGGGASATPVTPPLPGAGRKVCDDCKSIQDRIDADQDALQAAASARENAAQTLELDQNKLNSDQGQLEDFKQHPHDYDITETQINQKIAADQSRIADDRKKIDDATKEKSRLEAELRDLGNQLEDCLRRNCPPEHASSGDFLRDTLGHVSIGIGVGGGSGGEHHNDRGGQDNSRAPSDNGDR